MAPTRLTGGTKLDRFDVDDGWGEDLITDFQIGLDLFSQLTRTDEAGGVRIGFGGAAVLLAICTAAALLESDFLL